MHPLRAALAFGALVATVAAASRSPTASPTPTTTTIYLAAEEVRWSYVGPGAAITGVDNCTGLP